MRYFDYIISFYSSQYNFTCFIKRKEPPKGDSSRKSCHLLYRMSHDIKGVLSGHSECKLHRPSPKLDDAAYNLIFGKTGIVFRSAMRFPNQERKALIIAIIHHANKFAAFERNRLIANRIKLAIRQRNGNSATLLTDNFLKQSDKPPRPRRPPRRAD